MNKFLRQPQLNYYPAGCDALPSYACNNCDPQEMGRVRSVAIIHKDFAFVDPTSAAEWLAGINAGKIIIIPATNGSFDGGKGKEGPGYGNTESSYLGSSFTLKYNDPNWKANALFYNAIRGSRNYRVAFVTETQVHIANTPASFMPMNPVKDDLQSTIVWDVEVKWIDYNSPINYNIPPQVFVDCVVIQ